MDLTEFAGAVGRDDPVTIAGMATRGGPVAGVRRVEAPRGIEWVQADEMTMSCGAATPVAHVLAALAEQGQRVALPEGGTVGGALADGRSGVRALGDGPARDVLLQAEYVSAAGDVVKAGGPTVKNVSGFDLCRLLVGSQGTLGFLGSVILRTRPIARASAWFVTDRPASEVRARLYRPVSVLWNGRRTWVLLEGHRADLDAQAASAGLAEADAAPALPPYRWSMPPWEIERQSGTFVAEIGVGVVHRDEPQPPRTPARHVVELNRAIKQRLDPTARLNPGREPFAATIA